jgi:hypothetical protein
MMRYEHTQIGHTIIWGMLGVAVFVAITGTLGRGGLGTFLIAEAILLICGLLFWKLTIKIENGTLRARFGPGLVRKIVAIADIADVRAGSDSLVVRLGNSSDSVRLAV